MAIARKAIEAYLARPLRDPPLAIKGASREELLERIEEFTGFRPIAWTRHPPREGQLEGLCYALEMGRSILHYDMRLGKTQIGLEFTAHLQRAALAERKALILVPSPILTDVWGGQAKRFTDRRIGVLATPERARLEDALADDRLDGIAIAWTGVQALFTQKGKNRRGRPQLYPDLPALARFGEKFDIAVLDEIHCVGNPDSLRFQMAEALLGSIIWRLGLTGTLHGKNKLRAWAPVTLIDDGETFGRSLAMFEAVYGKPGGFKGKDVVFNKERAELMSRALASVSMPWKRADLEKGVMHDVVELHMYGEQLAAYSEVIEAQIARQQEPDNNERENVYVKLRQIASGYTKFIRPDGQEGLYTFASAKMDWFREFAAQLADGQLACVFFYEYTETGRQLVEILEKAKVRSGWLYGGTKNKPGIVADFQEGRIDVLVCNAASGGVGLDFSRADYEAFFESPTGAIGRAQAEKRAMGDARQGRALFIDDIVCSPVEKKILNDLKRGIDTMTEVYRKGGWVSMMSSLRVAKR